MENKQSKRTIEKQKRVENYETERNKMLALGYREYVGTISVLKANLLAFATAGPIAVLAVIIYLMKWKQVSSNMSDFLVFYMLLLVSIPVHELIHGIAWSTCCKKGWKSIHLGVMWEMLTPYCHCKEPLKFRSYLFGGLMPFLLLGIGVFVISIVTQNSVLLALSAINILAAGGDITISGMLFKYRDAEFLDHPTECGFIAFRKEP